MWTLPSTLNSLQENTPPFFYILYFTISPTHASLIVCIWPSICLPDETRDISVRSFVVLIRAHFNWHINILSSSLSAAAATIQEDNSVLNAIVAFILCIDVEYSNMDRHHYVEVSGNCDCVYWEISWLCKFSIDGGWGNVGVLLWINTALVTSVDEWIEWTLVNWHCSQLPLRQWRSNTNATFTHFVHLIRHVNIIFELCVGQLLIITAE